MGDVEWPRSSDTVTGVFPASLVGLTGPLGGGFGVLVRTGMLVTLSVATSRVPYVISLSSRSANRWRNRAYRPSLGKKIRTELDVDTEGKRRLTSSNGPKANCRKHCKRQQGEICCHHPGRSRPGKP
ncbi:hypothetical protein BR93DRAFT_330034 [Coniochaeta sp. PMI_546]|nr:hypothetical protein BR93DRAFT_330034 [Coniochaeta sp. PMI_546]